MPGGAKRPEWWTCGKCHAQVAVSAVVYLPLPSGALPHRRAVFEGEPGEVWRTALMVDGDGSAMSGPRYCPNCGERAEGAGE